MHFQGRVISYPSSIFYGVNRVNFEHNVYKICSSDIFSHASISCPSPFKMNLESNMSKEKIL